MWNLFLVGPGWYVLRCLLKSLQIFNSTTRFTSVSDWLRAEKSQQGKKNNPRKIQDINKIQNSAFKSQFYIFVLLHSDLLIFSRNLLTSDLFVQPVYSERLTWLSPAILTWYWQGSLSTLTSQSVQQFTVKTGGINQPEDQLISL